MAGGSEIFRGVIDAARKQVLTEHELAGSFKHRGIIGDERAAGLAKFIKARVPDNFAVGKGEIIDCYDNRSGQIDLFIYDRLAARPISEQSENLLIPCEALYAAIEIKSTLSREEHADCLKAASKLRDLRPFKGGFVDARTRGAKAAEDQYRCMYIVFAYATDLSQTDWLDKEMNRLWEVASEQKLRPSSIDRIFVERFGVLNPVRGQGKVVDEDAPLLFVELFLHLMNFIERERRRRPAIRWDDYAMPSRRGWKRIRHLPGGINQG